MSDKNQSSLPPYFGDLLDRTDEIFFSYDTTDNTFLYINKAFENIWQLTLEQLYADTSLLLKSIYEEDRAYIKEAYSNPQWKGTVHITEFRIVMPDASTKWIKLRACALQNQFSLVITGSAIDITTQKNYTDKLHKFASKKNSILEILSHDLVAPLNNVKLAGTLLNDEKDFKQGKNVSELLHVITNNTEKALELIKDFLKKEFVESIEVEIFKQRGDIVKKIREVFDQYKGSETDLKKTFNFITSAKSLFINFDDSKFMQVTNNLISNAIKFTPDNGVINVMFEEKQDSVLIQVEDNGVGIPEDLQPYLFDRFTKAKRPGLKGEKSIGLGMSIIKTIVEWHGGKIWFESTEGKGSVFYVEIPKD